MSGVVLLALFAFTAALVFALVISGWTAVLRKLVGEEALVPSATGTAVTFIIPARDAEDTIGALLQDLHAQRWPQHLVEVLVVDDASSDTTAAIVRGMMATWPNLRLLRNVGAGKKDAISLGVREAANDLIVMTDADARCGPLRLAALVNHLSEQPAQLVLMPVVTHGNGSWLGRVQVDEQCALLGAAMGSADGGTPLLAYGANMAFSKKAFQAVGGFQGDKWASGDDLFLLRRMQHAGLSTTFLARAETAVHVQAETGLGAFWRQRLRWAGKMRAVRGAGAWAGAVALLLPWFLLFATFKFNLHDALGQGATRILLLLTGAWCLWLVPVLGLVQQVKRSVLSSQNPPKRRDAFPTLLSLLAFSLYAPVVALASIFIRPTWKGRKI
ncbi:MAG: glycosyltransferase [Flavobacteriales bacterium]|nr:glycosyltransferase [Flavobacteriales bacterium]MBP9160078.1 glycosyltransferase [Flavobacteriales bacterium]